MCTFGTIGMDLMKCSQLRARTEAGTPTKRRLSFQLRMNRLALTV